MAAHPALIALHELAHVAALNAHPRVEHAFIRSEAGCFVAGTHDVPMQEFAVSREQVVRMLAAGIVSEWLYLSRTQKDPPMVVAALFHGYFDTFLMSACNPVQDAASLRQVLKDEHQEFTRTIYELARMLWPLVAGCDETVLLETYAKLEALPLGGELRFDTGRELMALAGVDPKRRIQ